MFSRPTVVPLMTGQQRQSAEKYHIPRIGSLQVHAHFGVFQPCLWPLNAPGYLGRNVAKRLVSPLTPVPRDASTQHPITS